MSSCCVAVMLCHESRSIDMMVSIWTFSHQYWFRELHRKSSSRSALTRELNMAPYIPFKSKRCTSFSSDARACSEDVDGEPKNYE